MKTQAQSYSDFYKRRIKPDDTEETDDSVDDYSNTSGLANKIIKKPKGKEFDARAEAIKRRLAARKAS